MVAAYLHNGTSGRFWAQEYARSTQHRMADIRVSIDRGGTFCDVIATVDGRDPVIFKLLSEDPANYPDAPTEAIRRILEKFEGRTIPVGEQLDASRIGLSSFLGGCLSLTRAQHHAASAPRSRQTHC